MKIADWFLKKNFSRDELYAAQGAIQSNLFQIIHETEKALHIRFITKYGIFAKWIPKSVVQF